MPVEVDCVGVDWQILPIMTAIEPTPIIPGLVERYTNAVAPAGLVTLSTKRPIAGSPEAALGSGLPSEPLIWRTYGPDGKLATLRTGCSFVAKV